MKPKFIKRANCWLVAIPKIVKINKQGQEFHWFSTEKEALNFLLNKVPKLVLEEKK